MKQDISNYLKSLFPFADFNVLTRLDNSSEGVKVICKAGFFAEPIIKSLISYASKHRLHFYMGAKGSMPEFHLYK